MSLIRKIVVLMLLVASTQVNAQTLREVHAKGQVHKVDEVVKSVNEDVTYRLFFNEIGKQVMYSKNRGELVRFELLKVQNGMYGCKDDQGTIGFNVTEVSVEIFWEHDGKYNELILVKTYDSLN